MDEAADLAMQAGVSLEALAQAHFLAESHYQVAVVHFGEFLG